MTRTTTALHNAQRSVDEWPVDAWHDRPHAANHDFPIEGALDLKPAIDGLQVESGEATSSLSGAIADRS